MPPNEKSSFICDACHQMATFNWTEEEANAEAEQLWGVKDASKQPGMMRVCDTCFNRLVKSRIN